MKTAVITGASSGIGLAALAELTQKGFRVIGIGRDQTRCEQVKQKILSDQPNASITFLCADLMQQREVERVATEISQILAEENDSMFLERSMLSAMK